MDETAPLTLEDLAEALGGVSTKTARRHLEKAMQADPGLSVTRRGRTLLFTKADIDRVLETLRWRPPGLDATTRLRTVSRASRGRIAQQQTAELLAQRRLARKRGGRV